MEYGLNCSKQLFEAEYYLIGNTFTNRHTFNALTKLLIEKSWYRKCSYNKRNIIGPNLNACSLDSKTYNKKLIKGSPADRKPTSNVEKRSNKRGPANRVKV